MYEPYQYKLNKLNKKLHQLAVELEKYRHEILTKKPEPEAWSVMQIMQHLLISEKLSLAYVKKKTSFQQTYKKADWKTKIRRIGLKIFLWLPLKFKAPLAVNADLFPNESDLGKVLKEWHNNRAELAQFFENIPEEWIGTEVYRHPRAGRLKLDDMLVFFEDHFNRHLKQIRRTLKALAA